jgi:phenylalanyl-tRNA synthetase beta chain
MKLSYNWLCDYVGLNDVDPAEIALKLTMSTSEIEGVEEVGDELKKVVVGKIVEVDPHPASDQLFVTRIDVGDAVLDVVSGAPNTRKGTFVPVALRGASLPGGLKVEKAKIRGVQSFGVVCSEKELGVSEDHTGLWILDEENVNGLAPGKPITSFFRTKDYIFDIDNKSITHRPDLWGHYGYARELAALYARPLAPVYSREEMDAVLGARGDEPVQVSVVDAELCPRYTAVLLSGIRIRKSSYLVRRRLHTLGVRPICNIVDVTNYIMLEIGQPLHAFDAAQISGGKIIVRRAREGERVATLDGVQRTLTSDTLLIADPEKSVGIAGVMGGLNSEISDLTERIIIEAANFNPVSIRRTAVRLGLRTEASNRFEKSLDPELTVLGIVGSVSRIRKELAGVRILSPLIDIDQREKREVRIPLNVDWVSRLLGVQIPRGRITGILGALQFGTEEVDEKNIMVRVPSFRATKDVSIPQDLVEEVGRIYGYGTIKPILPRIHSEPPHRDELVHFSRRLKRVLAAELAMTEVYTYSFQDDGVLGLFYPGDTGFVTLKNPVSRSMSRLRRSLLPGLYALIQRNLAYRSEFTLFEVGSVYVPQDGDGQGLPDERQMAAGLMLRKEENRPVFFAMKGKLELLLESFHLNDWFFEEFERIDGYENRFDVASLGEAGLYHPGRRALIVHGDTVFGMTAELNPKLLKDAGMDFSAERIAVFSIDAGLLMREAMASEEAMKYRKLPRYPRVTLALAIVVEESVPVRTVSEFILSHRRPGSCSDPALLEGARLFDIYRGKPLDPGKKSLAFNLYYRSGSRTLTEKEAIVVHEEIARNLRSRGWELR